ncbi:MAG: 4Fe-4S dicluster domain-containing protein [Candidatus Helarchaeota archaeon]
MVKINIDFEKCVGCGLCVNACPASIYYLTPESDKIQINNTENCLECKACEIQCQKGAIYINTLI